jgi:hypothetical protein
VHLLVSDDRWFISFCFLFLKVDREPHCEGERAACGRQPALCVTAPYEGFRRDTWSPGGWLAGRVGGAESVCWEANDRIATLCTAALCALIWPVPGVACFKACLTEAAVIVWLKRCQACWRDLLSNVVLYRAQALFSGKSSGWVNIRKFSSYLTENRVRLHYKATLGKLSFLI